MKKIVFALIVILLVILIKNTFFSVARMLGNDDVSLVLKKELEAEKKKNQFLKQRLFYVKTDEFVEEQARKKLGLVKPGEHTVIAPPEPQKGKETIEIDKTPNWEKWWKLFF